MSGRDADGGRRGDSGKKGGDTGSVYLDGSTDAAIDIDSFFFLLARRCAEYGDGSRRSCFLSGIGVASFRGRLMTVMLRDSFYW